MYETLIALLVFLVGGTCQYLQSPCQDVFQYKMDNSNELYGFVQVMNTGSSTLQLDVELSIGNYVGTDKGKISLANSYNIMNFDGNSIIQYNVYFPRWENIPPQVTKIVFNGHVMCSGPKITFGVTPIVTTVNLQHVLRIDIRQLSTDPQTSNVNIIRPQISRPSTNYGGRPPQDFDRRPPPEDFDRRPPPQDFDRRPPPQDFDRRPPPQDFDDKREPRPRPPNRRPSWDYEIVREPPARPRPRPTASEPDQAFPQNPFFASRQPPAIPVTSAPIPATPKVEIRPAVDLGGGSLNDICGRPLAVNSLIYNGQTVPRGAFPWLAALFLIEASQGVNLSYKCSSSLISNKHVVTAAHCVKMDKRVINPRDLLVVLGKLNIKKWTGSDGENNVGAESIHVHPEYEPLSADADIAVIVLSDTVQFTKFIRPICLWRGSTNLATVEGNQGTVVGWGRDESGELVTAEPKQTSLPIVSQETCLRSFAGFQQITSSRTFCAGHRNGSGPCNGDSGSGFIMNTDGVWTLRGIVSTSISDINSRTCDLSKYVVFTDAGKFTQWLQNFIS